MRTWTVLVLVLGIGIAACGGAQGGTSDGGTGGGADGNTGGNTDRRQIGSGKDACDLLQSDAVAPSLGVEWSEVEFKPGSESLDRMGRFLCTAEWQGSSPTELPRVILTVMGEDYSTDAKAVASLESAVTFLVERAKAKAAERGDPMQEDFEQRIDGVGDEAVFVGNNLLVAAGGVRFTINAKVEEPQDDRQRAIEVAQRVAGAL